MKIIKILNWNDLVDIQQKIEFRQLQYNEEHLMALSIVLMNYGSRYIKVKCVMAEWEGLKADIPLSDGIPLCPNGHPLFEVSRSPVLALIDEEDST
jgi:hypothetical protein